MWELIDLQTYPDIASSWGRKFRVETFRMAVPGGVLYRTVTYQVNLGSGKGSDVEQESMIFVPAGRNRVGTPVLAKNHEDYINANSNKRAYRKGETDSRDSMGEAAKEVGGGAGDSD